MRERIGKVVQLAVGGCGEQSVELRQQAAIALDVARHRLRVSVPRIELEEGTANALHRTRGGEGCSEVGRSVDGEPDFEALAAVQARYELSMDFESIGMLVERFGLALA